MNQNDKLRKTISSAPDAPGVYLMKDASGKIIYVGKAKSLKKRLLTYLGRDLCAKTQSLICRVTEIEFRLTTSEAFALLLEAGLIHQYKPRYNVALRDDKSFPFVKISNEDFPCISITRKHHDDGARYFGPYTNAKLLKDALKVIRRYFPYRSCSKLPKQACIYYRIGLSPAPCIGRISWKDYAATIENISLILQGDTDTLIKKLSAQMQEKSTQREYEAAAKIRDQINALSSIAASIYSRDDEMEDLRRELKLKRPPLCIEAFDISNIYGKEATGSLVSFYKGIADKDNYRRFRIKTVTGANDYEMLTEVLRRRYARLVEEKTALPDLVLIDGGKGHLFTAARAVRKLRLRIEVASIAKEKENIYCLNVPGRIRLKEGAPALNLIRRIRDEAHRFAVSYHHVLRRKKVIGK